MTSRRAFWFLACCCLLALLNVSRWRPSTFVSSAHTAARSAPSFDKARLLINQANGFDHAWGSLLRPYERQVVDRSANLLEVPLGNALSSPRPDLRILLVVGELSGLHKNGGIGTAYRALAEGLAPSFNVSILMIHKENAFAEEVVTAMRQAMQALNINLLFMPSSGSSIVTEPSDWAPRVSLEVHEYLSAQDGVYDVVHFHDNHGHGYHTMLAKKQGLFYQSTYFVVGLHGPNTGWATLINGELPGDQYALMIDHLERRSCEMADVLVSPSEYMLNYLLARGWQLPESRVVIWNLAGTESEEDKLIPVEEATSGTDLTSPTGEIDTIAYYGRFEARKGIHLFLAAITDLAAQNPAWLQERNQPLEIAFVGRDTIDATGRSVQLQIEEHGQRWFSQSRGQIRYKIVAGLDREAALVYLNEANRLIVIPSLIDNSPYTVMECIALGVNFLASAVGGIPELVHPEDRDNVLFHPNPTALFKKLSLALQAAGPSKVVRPAHPYSNSLDAWREVHLRLKTSQLALLPPAVLPSASVAVCTHFNGKNPMHLLDSLHSIEMQTLPAVSLALYSDRSYDLKYLKDDASRIAYDSAEKLVALRGWTWDDIDDVPDFSADCAARAEADYIYYLASGDVLHPEALSVLAGVANKSSADAASSSLGLVSGVGLFSDACDMGKSLVCRLKSRTYFMGSALSVGLINNKIGPDSLLVRRQTVLDVGGFRPYIDPRSSIWEFYLRLLMGGKSVTMVSRILLARKEEAAAPVVDFAMDDWLLDYQAFTPVLDAANVATNNLAPWLLYAKRLSQAHLKPPITPLAHSVADFSGMQGFRGWRYSFPSLPLTFPLDGISAFHHSSLWHSAEIVDSAPFVAELGMHPYRAPGNPMSLAAVRSWHCPSSVRNARVELDYQGFHSCGDGALIQIIHEDSITHSHQVLYNSSSLAKGPGVYSGKVDLTARSIIHLVVQAGANSHCDHVNARLRVMPPDLTSEDGSQPVAEPIEVLRQRSTPTVTDSTQHFTFPSEFYRLPEIYRDELSQPYCWRVRFFRPGGSRASDAVLTPGGHVAHVREGLDYPFVSYDTQHSSSDYSTSRYCRLDPPAPGEELVVQLDVVYPNATCTQCGDGVDVAFLVDGHRSLLRHLDMGEQISEEMIIGGQPPPGGQHMIDLRTASGENSWFDAVRTRVRVQRRVRRPARTRFQKQT